jgi:thymidine kinase
MGISLASLNVVKASDDAQKLDILDEESGKATGIVLSVIGSNSDKITKLVAKAVNGRRQAEELAKKKGKDVQPSKVEDDIEFAQELAAARIVGWEGIDEPFSPENALQLVTINPQIREQVMVFSDNASNYLKK